MSGWYYVVGWLLLVVVGCWLVVVGCCWLLLLVGCWLVVFVVIISVVVVVVIVFGIVIGAGVVGFVSCTGLFNQLNPWTDSLSFSFTPFTC